MEGQTLPLDHRAARSQPEANRPEGLSPRDWAPLPPPPAWPAKRSGGVAWELTLALLAVAILVSAVAVFLMAELWLADRVMPGVQVWGVELGGLTRDEATRHLATHFEYPANLHPTLRYGEQVWSVTPADMGMRIDLDTTVQAAMVPGRTGDLVSRLEEQVDVVRNGRYLMPTFTFDPGPAPLYLSRIASQVNRPAHNATLALNDNLQVEIEPAQIGIEVDAEATRQVLLNRLVEMKGGEVELAIRHSAPLLTDLGAAQAAVDHILSEPITLTAPDLGPWTIDRKTLAEWLVLRPAIDESGNPTLEVSIDIGPAAQIVAEIAPQVAKEPQDASFDYDVERERVVTTVESTTGQRLDITTTMTLIEEAIANDERTIPLPLVAIPPSVASGDAPAVETFELIGEGKSNFSGSTAARVQNIVVGTYKFDGLLIAPGETFSFNQYLGEVTAKEGYAESIIIWGNETTTDVGGGLCQVSTTAFRAAFWAGLPMVERWPHLFRVSYYEPPRGMDATIYTPTVDLKWLNDTEEYILIRTLVDKKNKNVIFRFYGRDTGRTVEMDGPHESRLVHPPEPEYRQDPNRPKGETKQIQWAKDGLDVTVNRIIKQDGKEVSRDSFFSRYQPWQAVYLVGTKEN